MTPGTPAVTGGAARQRPVHVVQISRDGDLLRLPSCSEPVQRQLDYARELSLRAPGSIVTIIVFSSRSAGLGWRRENVHVVSVPASARGALALPGILQALHRATPISVITTQVPCDEGWLVLALARWYRIPVIAQIHSDLFAGSPRVGVRQRLAGAAHRWLTRTMLSRFAAVRTVSSSNRTAVAKVAPRVPLATIPVPVAMVPLRRSAASREPAKEPLVLFVGRLAPEKNLFTWLQVASVISRRHPEARFVVAGDGPELARLQVAAATLGLARVIEFAGFVPYSELPSLYARATAVLLTSHAEGFARVLVEAASQGTAAVSTASAGPRDIIINGVTGFLHEAEDVAALADSVCVLLREPARAAMMGAQARTLVSVKFNPQRLRSAWVDLWVTTARQAAPSA
jgi:glycosyltransferase involved in cell wall biosynthesis